MAIDNSSEFESNTYPNMTRDAQAELNYNMTMAVLPVTIFIGLECLVGLFGNVLILLIYTLHYRKSTFRCMVLTMAVVDLTSCLTTLPGEIFSQMNWYHYENGMICKVKSFFNVLTAFSSAEILFVLAFDRYRKVCRPLAWQLQPSTALRLCVGSVVVGSIVASPALVLWGRQDYLYVDDANVTINVSICEKSGQYAEQIYPFLYITFVYTLPLGLLMLMICGLNILTSKTLFCGIGNLNGDMCKNASVCTIASGASFTQSTGFDSVVETNVNIDSNNLDATFWLGNNAQNDTLRVKDITISVNATSGSNIVPEDLVNTPATAIFEQHDANEQDVNRIQDTNTDAYGDTSMTVPNSKVIPTISDLESQNDDRSEGNECVQNKNDNPHYPRNTLKHLRKNLSLTKVSSSTLESPDSVRYQGSAGRHGDTAKQRRKRKTLIMLVLTSVFVVTMLMYIIMTMFVADSDGTLRQLSTSGKVVFFMFWRMYFINCLVNPVLYGFVDPRFRSGLRRLFTRPVCCQRKNNNET